jgi:regulator of nonsense transcripts 1
MRLPIFTLIIGDCLKLRAAHHEKLSHLVDCVVFATVARPGHHSAPSMSSGGDLDGEQFQMAT